MKCPLHSNRCRPCPNLKPFCAHRFFVVPLHDFSPRRHCKSISILLPSSLRIASSRPHLSRCPHPWALRQHTSRKLSIDPRVSQSWRTKGKQVDTTAIHQCRMVHISSRAINSILPRLPPPLKAINNNTNNRTPPKSQSTTSNLRPTATTSFLRRTVSRRSRRHSRSRSPNLTICGRACWLAYLPVLGPGKLQILSRL